MDVKKAVERALELVNDGCDLLDIVGQPTNLGI